MSEMNRHDNQRKCFAQSLKVLCAILLFSFVACVSKSQNSANTQPQASSPNRVIPYADGFDYPIGKTATVTEAKDKDGWYNAQDFTENNHLGEDWNANTGGNTDCGEPVYASANGVIVYAEDAGAGWGNVVIIEHLLIDGTKVQTLYGHLESIIKKSGEVKRREKIGTVGNANGRYYCHLHFEVRFADCPVWNTAGQGYSTETKGWIDPSKFIDANRPANVKN